jgi:glutamyl-Q tRNA(Asp) synthetase
MADFGAALDRLRALGVLYPCFCTRRDVTQSVTAPHGPDGPIYPGTCRRLSDPERAARIGAATPYAVRLDLGAALAMTGPLAWHDRDAGTQEAAPELFGDIVVARRDVGTSYHLAVVVDDGAQGVTLVTRGADLFDASHVQRVLQALLGLPAPDYHHHRLILDADGRRLAKRTPGVTLADLRASGVTPAEIRARVGFD